MSSGMKYVVVDTGLCEVIIVFPEVVPHDTMRNAFSKIISAGFIYMNNEGLLICYGKSVGLDLKSRGQTDSEIANRQLRFRRDQ